MVKFGHNVIYKERKNIVYIMLLLETQNWDQAVQAVIHIL